MAFILGAYVFLVGLALGSFLNVFILRYNTNTSLLGRSSCPSCGRALHWYELVPLFSFLVQLGRCRGCRVSIAWQYPLVELLTGLGVLLLHLRFFSGALSGAYAAVMLFYTLVFGITLAILVYDLRHKIVPDGLVYGFALLALGALFVTWGDLTLRKPEPLELLSGPLLFLPFFALWSLSRGKWMGLGDGKLALGIGWLLGLGQGLTAVLVAFWSGALVSLILLALQALARRFGAGRAGLFFKARALTMKSEIPFAPFLIAGLWFVFFTGFNFISVLSP